MHATIAYDHTHLMFHMTDRPLFEPDRLNSRDGQRAGVALCVEAYLLTATLTLEPRTRSMYPIANALFEPETIGHLKMKASMR
jgi:hypothetical protein